VNESVDATKCQGTGDCQNGETCLTHSLWEDLSEQIHLFLESISLADLVTKNEVRRISENQDKKHVLIADRISGMQLPVTSL
jgi:Rrf2 family iron-sulfur cluster assembly transcriptional regulator